MANCFLSIFSAFLLSTFPFYFCFAQQVEKIDPVFSSNSLEDASTFAHDGSYHWVGFFDRADDSSRPGSAFYVNLTSGIAESFPQICPGRYNGTNKSLIGNSLFAASGDPGYLCEFQIPSRTWINRGKYGVLPVDKASFTRVGGDGKLYLGTAVRGALTRWNPGKLTFEQYGVVDPPVLRATTSSALLRLASVQARGGVVTVQAELAHHFPVGTQVKVIGSANGALDSTYAVSDVPNPESFRFSAPNILDGNYIASSLEIRNVNCDGCYRYIYTFGLSNDGLWIYLAMRDASVDRWWLVVRSTDPAQKAEKVCWEDAGYKGVEVFYGTNSVPYVVTYPGNKTYLLQGGECPLLPVSTIPARMPWDHQQAVLSSPDPNRVVEDFGIEVNYDRMYADSSNTGGAVLSYRVPPTQSWTERQGTISIYPSILKDITGMSSNVLLLSAGSYGPFASLVTGEKVPTIKGSVRSLSHYVTSQIGTKLLLSGYPSVSYLWDSSLPWSAAPNTVSVCTTSNATNPCLAKQGWGKYHRYSLAGSDSEFYVASEYERQEGVGGELGWINSQTLLNGSLRAPFKCFAPRDLIVGIDANSLLISGSAQTGGIDACAEIQGRIFVLDSASKTVTRTLPAPSGYSSSGKLLNLHDGTVLGFVRSHPDTSHYSIYRLNLGTGAVIWQRSYSGTLSNEFGLIAGKNDEILFSLNRAIKSISKDSGQLLNTGITLNPGDGDISSFYGLGRDLWFSAGTALYVWRAALPGGSTAPIAPKNLRLISS